MADLITRSNFKTRQGITITSNDARIDSHITAASRDVQNRCGRSFDVVTVDTVASDRVFSPIGPYRVRIDDAVSISAVAVDLDDSGNYATTLSASDYITEPANGLGPGGLSGFPIEELVIVNTAFCLPRWRRPPVKVTAKWGWAAVPVDVVEACYMITNRLYYEVAVPGGVTQANVEFGLPGTPLQRQYTVDRLLAPYTRLERSIGIAG